MRVEEVSAYDFVDLVGAYQEVAEFASADRVSDLLHLLEETRHERFEGASEGGLQCLNHREGEDVLVSQQQCSDERGETADGHWFLY